MNKIYLISCVKSKLPNKARARELYTSSLFKKMYAYAEKRADKIYILSAKHGLVDAEEVIEPYEETLNKKTKMGKKLWAVKVFQKLLRQENLKKAEIVFLAGVNYRKFLEILCDDKKIKHSAPMDGLGIGKQLAWLTKNV